MRRACHIAVRRSILLSVALLVSLFVADPVDVAAQAPETVSFQGQVVDASGDPLTGYHTMRVRLYDSTGAVVYDESGSGTTTDGLFNFHIGPLDDVVFDGPMQISVEIDGGGEMPREDIEAVPFALGLRGFHAAHSDYQGWTGLNVVGGHPDNFVGTNATGATIAGGGLRNPSDQAVPNSIEGTYGGTIGGGYGNQVLSGEAVTIGGGYRNKGSAANAAIAGGILNEAAGFSSAVGGGSQNKAGAMYATVGGGTQNAAEGDFSTVPGGFYNSAAGEYSFAAGFGAIAAHSGSFAWSDDSNPSTQLETTADHQFLIRAAGGVGIGTNAPTSQLSVIGDADLSGKLGVGTSVVHAALHAERDNILVGVEDTWDDVIIGEADDAIVGLYSSSDGTYGSGIALAQMAGLGLLNSKWGVVRTNENCSSGDCSTALRFTYGSGSNITGNDLKAELTSNGALFTKANIYPNGFDIAESFGVIGLPGRYEPGDVMALSPRDGHRLERASSPYSTLVAGVYATRPGIVLSDDPMGSGRLEERIPLGVLGVIPTKVCAENGPISVGDLLVTSSTPGHAMRGSRERLSFGMVIGKAMEAFEGSGCGTIDVLVNVK